MNNLNTTSISYYFVSHVCVIESSVISQYPNSPEYPKFYNLGNILKNMVKDVIKVHPYTREMLSSLDQ